MTDTYATSTGVRLKDTDSMAVALSTAVPVRCDHCRFWALGGYQSKSGPVYGNQGHQGNGDHADCRLRPPVADPTRQDSFMGNALWPVTARSDWCGEFSPREAAPNENEPGHP